MVFYRGRCLRKYFALLTGLNRKTAVTMVAREGLFKLREF